MRRGTVDGGSFHKRRYSHEQEACSDTLASSVLGCRQGITRKQYDLYYQDQEIAIAYRLGNVYDYPTSLWMLPAPQGYRYLRQEMYHQFRCQTGRPRLVHASCGCAD